MEPVQVNLEAYRGDSWTQSFNLKRDGLPYNLTGSTVASWAAFDGSHTVLPVTVIDAPGGRFSIGLPSTMKAGKYQYDVEVTDSGGLVTTWIRGILDVQQDVTNAV